MSDKTIIITSSAGKDFSGYLASAKNGKGPGIVMVQEIFGVNPSIREAADRFAQEGFTVVAPDIFWRFKPNVQLGYEGADLEEAFGYYHNFNVMQGVEDIGRTIETLRHHPACNGKVAVLGFCLGGKLAYLTAAHHTTDAAVAFYGGGIAEHLNVADSISCPMLLHFGEQDEMISADQIEAIRAAFAGRTDVEIAVYPGVGHAFYNHKRASYNPEAAQLAHKKTLDFLKKRLVG